MQNRKNHWEQVYKTKQSNEMSWTEAYPQASLELIQSLNLPLFAKIIDVGGGDSLLVDSLLDLGYTNLTILDISEFALEKAKQRLGDRAQLVTWVVSDICDFNPSTTYDCWHDRATFHFLLDENDIQKYIATTNRSIDRYLIIGTFSNLGPKRCSNLEIHQYNEIGIEQVFINNFTKIGCKSRDHLTPFSTLQNFLFCVFKKK